VFVGSIIFAGVAVLCVVAFFIQQKRRREYEESDE
jgi:hypothetical protein